MSKPLDVNDASYWMLERGIDESTGVRPNTGWVSQTTVYNPDCYICEDPEFALMGLPLCKPCPVVVDGVVCGEHTPADDTVCDAGHDTYEWYMEHES